MRPEGLLFFPECFSYEVLYIKKHPLSSGHTTSNHFTESQNGWDWKGPLEVTWPSHVPAGTPRATSRQLWKIPKGTPQSLESLCQHSITHKAQKSSWCSEGTCCVPISSGSGTGHYWAELGSSFLAPSLQGIVDIEEIPLNLLFSRPSSLRLFSWKCSTPMILVGICWTFSSISRSLLYWEAQNWRKRPDLASSLLRLG